MVMGHKHALQYLIGDYSIRKARGCRRSQGGAGAPLKYFQTCIPSYSRPCFHSQIMRVPGPSSARLPDVALHVCAGPHRGSPRAKFAPSVCALTLTRPHSKVELQETACLRSMLRASVCADLPDFMGYMYSVQQPFSWHTPVQCSRLHARVRALVSGHRHVPEEPLGMHAHLHTHTHTHAPKRAQPTHAASVCVRTSVPAGPPGSPPSTPSTCPALAPSPAPPLHPPCPTLRKAACTSPAACWAQPACPPPRAFPAPPATCLTPVGLASCARTWPQAMRRRRS